jgi:hypothetical protein
MISHPRGHGWGNGVPTPFRATATSRFGATQGLPPALVWQYEVILGQGAPQWLFQPSQLLAKPVGLARQAPMVLAQSEVSPLDQAGVNGGTGGQHPESGRSVFKSPYAVP